jgi:hypothetical protein
MSGGVLGEFGATKRIVPEGKDCDCASPTPVKAQMTIAAEASKGRLVSFAMVELLELRFATTGSVHAPGEISYRNRRAFHPVECYVPRGGTQKLGI